MMPLIIVIHVIACIGLITLVLIQRGRGSGLVETFQGVESMFGTRTNVFLTRTTTILSIIFFLSCLSLAALSIRQARSIMRNVNTSAAKPVMPTAEQSAAQPQTATQPPAPSTQPAQLPVAPPEIKTEANPAQSQQEQAPKQ